MDDQDVLFSFDDEPDDDDLSGEEGSNRTFLIGAIALAGVFLLGICLVIYLAVIRPQQQPAEENPIQLTNEANMTLAAATQTAAAAVVEQPEEVAEGGEEGAGEEQPVEEETEEPAATPTSSVEETEEATESAEGGEEGGEEGDGTEVAEVEQTPTLLGGGEEEGVAGEEGATEEASAVAPTSSIIQVTPLGGGAPTPTRIGGSGEDATEEPSGVGGPTGGTVPPDTPGTGGGIGGPIAPDATLPTTGLLDGGAGLAGFGLLAVALVAVVVVVRRIRLSNHND